MDDIFPNDVNISVCHKILSEYDLINEIISENETHKNTIFTGIKIAVFTAVIINIYDSIKINNLVEKFQKIKSFGSIERGPQNLFDVIRFFRDSACHSDSGRNKYTIVIDDRKVGIKSLWNFHGNGDELVIQMGNNYIYYYHDMVRAMNIITGDFREAV